MGAGGCGHAPSLLLQPPGRAWQFVGNQLDRLSWQRPGTFGWHALACEGGLQIINALGIFTSIRMIYFSYPLKHTLALLWGQLVIIPGG